jgi:uncharacterized integral membrane protein
MRTVVGVLLALVPAVYLVLVGTWNDAPTSLNLIFTKLEGQTLGVTVLGAFLLGAALTGLAFSWPILRVRLRLRRESKRVAQLEQEVHGLRTLPLTEDDDAKAVEAREA